MLEVGDIVILKRDINMGTADLNNSQFREGEKAIITKLEYYCWGDDEPETHYTIKSLTSGNISGGCTEQWHLNLYQKGNVATKVLYGAKE